MHVDMCFFWSWSCNLGGTSGQTFQRTTASKFPGRDFSQPHFSFVLVGAVRGAVGRCGGVAWAVLWVEAERRGGTLALTLPARGAWRGAGRREAWAGGGARDSSTDGRWRGC